MENYLNHIKSGYFGGNTILIAVVFVASLSYDDSTNSTFERQKDETGQIL
jgi:hypothetical protein